MKKKIFCYFLLCFVTVKLQAQTSFVVNGVFIAPPGTTVILQNNNTDLLSLVAKKDAALYSINPFKFSKQLNKDARYNITIKSSPAAMATKMTNENGVLSATGKTLVVECDYKFDLVSRSTKDEHFSTFYECFSPAVAGATNEEGRYVAFVSNSVKFGGASGKYRQIFWRDRNTGITKLVSIAANGDEGNGDSNSPSMSVDGHSVAFESYANNLVAGDKNGVRDIFIWDAVTGNIQRVSTGPGGIEANGESSEPSLGTGEIAFTSYASNLVNGVDAASMMNVYWRNLQTGEQKMLSVDYKTKKGAGGARPSISIVAGDETKISFSSSSPNLVPGDKNDFWDIFLYSKNKPLKRISLTYNGGERNQGNESATRDVRSSISGDGRYVAFATTASNMVPDDKNNAQDVFVVNTQTDSVVRVSVSGTGQEGNADSPIGQGEKIAISYDGTWTAFNTMATNLGTGAYNFIMHNRTSGETRAITNSKESCITTQPVMSINGSYVVFGMCTNLDTRFKAAGIFASYTAISGTRFRDQATEIKK